MFIVANPRAHIFDLLFGESSNFIKKNAGYQHGNPDYCDDKPH